MGFVGLAARVVIVAAIVVGLDARLVAQHLLVEPLPVAAGSTVRVRAEDGDGLPIIGLAIELGTGLDPDGDSSPGAGSPVFEPVGATGRDGALALVVPHAGNLAVRAAWRAEPDRPVVWLLTPIRVLPAPPASGGWFPPTGTPLAVAQAVLGIALAWWWLRRAPSRRAP